VENNNPGDQGKEAMKDRSTQLGVRQEPDSPRVHGLRLTVDSASLRFGSQTGNSPRAGHRRKPRDLVCLALRAQSHIKLPSRSGTALKQLDSFGYTLKTVKRMARRGQIPRMPAR